jgi:hypothetical protein
MPILKDLREAQYLTDYDRLPVTVQEKICAIEVLFDRAILYIWARTEASKGVPDFGSFLSDLYENRIKSPENDVGDLLKDLLGKLEPEDQPFDILFCLGGHESRIKKLADSRYYPWPGNWSHLIIMLFTLWAYWMSWPADRRFFEKGNETTAWYIRPSLPAPPSAPNYEANLDLSLVWLAHEIGSEIIKIKYWMKKKEGFAQINLEQRTENTQKVINAFHQVEKNQGDTLNCIVTRIFKKLEETISKKTIERYLKDNTPLMAHCFKLEQRGEKTRIIYIGHTSV